MITNLQITNFRQHKNLVLDFSNGVTVIRGDNEKGKSTIFEAIAYALFGLRSCRDSDVTSWGETPNSHRVDLEFIVSGQTYNVYRTAKSCELRVADDYVSGQTEVTRFCEQLLEIQSGTGNWLMFVPQNKIKGILEETNAKTTAFIEKLANFELIDNMIENLQANHPTGSTKNLIDSIGEADKRLKDYIEVMPEDKADELLAQADKVDEEIVEVERICQKVGAQVERLRTEYQELEKYSTSHAILSAQKHAAEGRRQMVQQFLDENQVTLVDHSKKIAAIDEAVKQMVAGKSQEESHKKGTALVIRLKMMFNRDTESAVRMRYSDARKAYQNCMDEVFEISEQLKHLELRSKTLNGTCEACGLDYKDVPEIVAKTQSVQDEIKKLQQVKIAADEKMSKARIIEDKASNDILIIEDIMQFMKTEPYGWEFDPDTLTLAFRGELPTSSDNYDRLVADRQRFVYEENDAKQKLMHYQQKETELELVESQLESLNNQLMLCGDFSKLGSVKLELDTNETDLLDAKHLLDKLKKSVYELRAEAANNKIAIDHHNMFIGIYEKQLAEQEEQLATMDRNNTLLKMLRGIKPQIANSVWQGLCNSISKHFSDMRGFESVVTKEDSFLIDGHPVSSFSGSTVDVLGIAIRVALTKTFMPNSNFLLLDEPFSACDVDRQSKALSCLSSVGFDQLVIITHEEETESVADNLIDL